ncbi:hypothetical protein NQK81_20880 [Amycolatopsis roodepoortensis]|uniref:hypothetical protein n=1 Tax=Amycolatopsis roodepoortensis TaxID=700274 RepID=UPI00214B92AD|nr:hypothetical protein [Amycolatopsis roodepoortensis]UUV35791.1 hypothetical protein NQK81_20880 [Amycolatopsis roodepoortensis]
MVRQLTRKFEGSNPTWVRRAGNYDELVDISPRDLDDLIISDQYMLMERLKNSRVQSNAAVSLLTGSSARLPLQDDSVDLVLTSPPYLTRIDYAVSYSRELAVLGVDISVDRRLRSSLMGTTLIRPSATESTLYGDLANDLVRQVSEHKSKASSGYYRKQVVQYLDDLVGSLSEIDRVCRKESTLILVVQDSYYKDVAVRLADICEDEVRSRGWSISGREEFEVSRSLTTVNKAAQAYVKGKVSETVLTLRKE